MKVPYSRKDGDVVRKSTGQREQPQIRMSVGSLSEEDSKRFETSLDWFLADIVQRVMAKREIRVDGKFEAQR